MTEPIFTHVFVIGAASNDVSKGQIPSAESIQTYAFDHPGRTLYFYFIDPKHADNAKDFEALYALIEAGISLSIIPRNFEPDKFLSEYKVFPEDQALFIDYAKVLECEQEWLETLPSENHLFWSAYAAGSPVLCLKKAFSAARAWKRYNLYTDS